MKTPLSNIHGLLAHGGVVHTDVSDKIIITWDRRRTLAVWKEKSYGAFERISTVQVYGVRDRNAAKEAAKDYLGDNALTSWSMDSSAVLNLRCASNVLQ